MTDHATMAQLFGRYGSALDDDHFEWLDDIFTSDAEYTIYVAGGETIGPVSSREKVVEMLTGALKQVNAEHGQTRHAITNMWADGDTARAVLTQTVTSPQGELAVLVTGTYTVEMGEEDGQTRMRVVHLRCDKGF